MWITGVSDHGRGYLSGVTVGVLSSCFANVCQNPYGDRLTWRGSVKYVLELQAGERPQSPNSNVLIMKTQLWRIQIVVFF